MEKTKFICYKYTNSSIPVISHLSVLLYNTSKSDISYENSWNYKVNPRKTVNHINEISDFSNENIENKEIVCGNVPQFHSFLFYTSIWSGCFFKIPKLEFKCLYSISDSNVQNEINKLQKLFNKNKINEYEYCKNLHFISIRTV